MDSLKCSERRKQTQHEAGQIHEGNRPNTIADPVLVLRSMSGHGNIEGISLKLTLPQFLNHASWRSIDTLPYQKGPGKCSVFYIHYVL
jgi:hypothetical protein